MIKVHKIAMLLRTSQQSAQLDMRPGSNQFRSDDIDDAVTEQAASVNCLVVNN